MYGHATPQQVDKTPWRLLGWATWMLFRAGLRQHYGTYKLATNQFNLGT